MGAGQDRGARAAPQRSAADRRASRDKRRANHPRLCRPAAAAGHAGGKGRADARRKGRPAHAGGPALLRRLRRGLQAPESLPEKGRNDRRRARLLRRRDRLAGGADAGDSPLHHRHGDRFQRHARPAKYPPPDGKPARTNQNENGGAAAQPQKILHGQLHLRQGRPVHAAGLQEL